MEDGRWVSQKQGIILEWKFKGRNGKPKQISSGIRNTGARSVAEAYRIVRARQEQYYIDNAVADGVATFTVKALGEWFCHELAKQGKSELQLKEGEAQWFRSICATMNPEFPAAKLDDSALYTYIEARRRLGKRDDTTRRHVNLGLVKALRWANERLGLPFKITKNFKPRWITGPETRHPGLKGKERPLELIQAVLAYLPSFMQDQVIFDYTTGLRDGELHRIERSWVKYPNQLNKLNIETLYLPAWATKTRKAREVPLGEDALAAFERQVAANPGAKQVFARDKNKTLEKASEALGVYPVVTLRDLRHTFACNALDGNGNRKGIADVLGHSLATNERYVHGSPKRSLDAVRSAAKVGKLTPVTQCKVTITGDSVLRTNVISFHKSSK